MDQDHRLGIEPTSPILIAALDYAATFGWTSFPAPVGTKKSHKKGKRGADNKLIARWDATNDPDKIRADRRTFGRANIGVPTGPDNGFFVVDADTIAGGHAADGITSLADLESKRGTLPTTLMARSPSGSIHYYFKYPLHMRVGGSRSKIAPGVDICGDKNMVIVPPSVKGDGVYEWLNPGVAIADAPTWLLDLIAEAAKPKVLTIREQAVALIKIPENAFVRAGKASGDLTERRRAAWHATVFQAEVDRVANAATGERNAVLFQATANLGGYILGGADFTPDDVRAAMVAASKRNGSLDEDGEQQIDDTINSGLQLDRTRRVVPDFTDHKPQTDNVVRLVAPAPEEAVDDVANIIKLIAIDWAEVDKIRTESNNLAALPPDVNATAALILGFKGNRIPDLNVDLARSGAVVDKPFVTWNDVAFSVAQILRADTRLTDEKIAAVLLCPLPCNQIVTKEKNTTEKHDIITRLLWRTIEQVAVKKKETQAEQAKQAAKLAKQAKEAEKLAKQTAAEQAKQLAKLPREDEPDWRECRLNGSPMPSMHNARLAIDALGIKCSRDVFHNKTLFGYRDDTVKHELQSIVGEVTDDGVIGLRQKMSDKFGFDLEDKSTRDAVRSLALQNCFNPVCDLIDKAQAEWDGVKRLDEMAVTHFNCEDTPLNRAFLRKTVIAMVARARVPGIKFDTITVLESAEGYNKSTAWRVLAGDENFSDEAIIGKQSREVQEQLSEIWLHENADLAGIKKAEVETVKAFASRTTDIARAAFAHYVVKQPRHSIEVGSTNSDEYLQSQTGNRRFWPLKVLKAIDIAMLKRDRLQLLGEAATYQAAGESVVLAEAMWPDAGVQQNKRRIKHPWEATLALIHERHQIVDLAHPGGYAMKTILHYLDGEERVSSRDLLTYVLGLPIGHQTVAHTMQLSTTMQILGWERTENKIWIEKEQVRGFYRKQTPQDVPDDGVEDL